MPRTATWRVNYHGGNLYSLVEADRPETAVAVAKAWRERKYGHRAGAPSKPPKSVLTDTYTVRQAMTRDIEWAAKFRIRPYTTMPPVRLVKAGHDAARPSRALRGHKAA